jgi:hypothetical protein
MINKPIFFYKQILEKELNGSSKTKAQELSILTQQLTKLEERKSTLQNTFIKGEITSSDYTELKPVKQPGITKDSAEIDFQVKKAGGKLIGTKDGKRVFEFPDGTHAMEE